MLDSNLKEETKHIKTITDTHALLRGAKLDISAGEEASWDGLEHFRSAGAKLQRVKDSCTVDGEWSKHLSGVGINERQARRYMLLHREWDLVRGGGAKSLTQAFRIITSSQHENVVGTADHSDECQSTPDSVESGVLKPLSELSEGSTLDEDNVLTPSTGVSTGASKPPPPPPDRKPSPRPKKKPSPPSEDEAEIEARAVGEVVQYLKTCIGRKIEVLDPEDSTDQKIFETLNEIMSEVLSCLPNVESYH